jgi:hypothetical protein
VNFGGNHRGGAGKPGRAPHYEKWKLLLTFDVTADGSNEKMRITASHRRGSIPKFIVFNE